MKWLLTTRSNVDQDHLREELSKLETTLRGEPIPLEGDEQVLEADGPADLPARVDDSGAAASIVKVSPDSGYELY